MIAAKASVVATAATVLIAAAAAITTAFGRRYCDDYYEANAKIYGHNLLIPITLTSIAAAANTADADADCINNGGRAFASSTETVMQIFADPVLSWTGDLMKVYAQIDPPYVIGERNGADISFFQLLAKHLNCSVEFSLCKGSDCSDFQQRFRGSDERTTRWYHKERIVLCHGKISNDWNKLSIVMGTQSYMIVPIALQVFVTWSIAKFIADENEQFKSIQTIILTHFRVISNVPNHILPSSRPLRLLYTSWLLFCLILTVNYSTLILRVFPGENYVPKVRNLNEALAKNFRVYASWSACNDNSDIDTYSCLHRLLQQDQTLLAIEETFLKYHYYWRASSVHCFEEEIGHYERKIRLLDTNRNRNRNTNNNNNTDGDVMDDDKKLKLDAFISRVNGGGLYKRALTLISAKRKIEEDIASGNGNLHTIGLFAFRDYLIIYLYLPIGFSVAAIAFGGELLWHRYGRTRSA